jgi:hypothetical protein
VYWFSGRYVYYLTLQDSFTIYSHRLTPNLIGLFLSSQNVPRHRVLTLFAEHLTRLKITDALELEDGEYPVSPNLSSKIALYGPLTELDRLFEEPKLTNSQCNTSLTDSGTNRAFDRRGIDTMSS